LHLEIKTSRNWNDQVKAYYSAKAGFETALANLRADETSYDSLDEEWAEGYTDEINDSTFETTITDESSFININTIDESTLARVIEYCLMNPPNSDEEPNEAEVQSQAQELASAIIAKRPFRTPSEVAKVDGMTPEILYGYDGSSKYLWKPKNNSENTDEGTTNTTETNVVALIDIITTYSVDKNVSSDGQKRVNINSASANDIQQGVNSQNQQTITQQEAQAIVDYRSSQSNQGGNQGGQPQGGQAQGANQAYNSIVDLLNVPAISQETFNSIRDRISVDDTGGNQGNQGNQQGNQQQRININSADANQLRNLSNRIDDGIADSIVRYRQNNRFDNIDELLQVRAISIQDLKAIVDRITTTDNEVLEGKININTIPSELLRILPGMDKEKAETIIAYRESGATQGTKVVAQSNQQGGAIENVGQLLDIQGIDENTFRQLVDLITYRSSSFRIYSIGKSLDEKITSEFIAIVDRSGNSIKTKYWRQL